MNLEEYERIQPNTMVDGMLFYLPNRHCEWRVQTIYTKEPDTVAWIRSMKHGEVFYDVGANIGLYTMLAVKHGLQVFAFEPESQNFAVLTRNLMLNKVPKDRAVAFPFCISDSERVDTLRLSSMVAGGSCHSFASDKNYQMVENQWAYEQGTVGFTLDALVLECKMPHPDHIKIDVDGFDDKVLGGAKQVLRNVKSVLVEMDSNNATHMGWRNHLIDEYGFAVDEEQVDAARRKEGPFTGIGNIIFRKGDSHDAQNDAGAEAVPASLGTSESHQA